MQLWVIDLIQSASPEGLSPTEKQGGSALESDHQKAANDALGYPFSLLALPDCVCV